MLVLSHASILGSVQFVFCTDISLGIREQYIGLRNHIKDMGSTGVRISNYGQRDNSWIYIPSADIQTKRYIPKYQEPFGAYRAFGPEIPTEKCT